MTAPAALYASAYWKFSFPPKPLSVGALSFGPSRLTFTGAGVVSTVGFVVPPPLEEPPVDPPVEGLFTSGAFSTSLPVSTSLITVSLPASTPSTLASTLLTVPLPSMLTGASAVNVPTVLPFDTSMAVSFALSVTITFLTSAFTLICVSVFTSRLSTGA